MGQIAAIEGYNATGAFVVHNFSARILLSMFPRF